MIQGAVTEERPIQIEQPRVWPRYFWVVNYMPHYHVPETHGSMAFVLNCDASSGVCDLEVLHRNGAWERICGVRYRGTADYEKFPETREQPCWEWAWHGSTSATSHCGAARWCMRLTTCRRSCCCICWSRWACRSRRRGRVEELANRRANRGQHCHAPRLSRFGFGNLAIPDDWTKRSG